MKTKLTFEEYLRKDNLSKNTITSYLWTVNYYTENYDAVSKENLLAYKGYLMEFFKPKTVNLRIQAINKYLEYLDKQQLQLKAVKVQQKNFLENVISNADYNFLKKQLKKDGNMEWYFVIWYLAATGARVSELIQIKIEHIEIGYFDLYTKGGKLRRLYIPKKLKKETLEWLEETHRFSGYLFLNRYGERITTRGISQRLKNYAEKYGLDMIEYINEDGVKKGINPFDHGSSYTDIMKTQALKQALDKYGFTAAFGGGRRDEEKSRAKERIFSFRNSSHAWDPKNQRPEMWKLYNTNIHQGEEMRVFPISNWTEKDIWQYIQRENIDIVPLYFAAERPFVRRNGNIIMVDDDRMRLEPGEKIEHGKIRFRTLGCYPLTGGIESDADTLDAIIDETLSAVSSERTSRVIDSDGGAASMEKRKREGYF